VLSKGPVARVCWCTLGVNPGSAPVPTTFTDEVLENVGGQEAYSFTNRFLGYHRIRIALQDRHKTTFSTKWGSYQYTIIPFGLKNTPSIFSRVVVAAFKYFIHKVLEVCLDDWIIFIPY
jgi:hypothetical protein